MYQASPLRLKAGQQSNSSELGTSPSSRARATAPGSLTWPEGADVIFLSRKSSSHLLDGLPLDRERQRLRFLVPNLLSLGTLQPSSQPLPFPPASHGGAGFTGRPGAPGPVFNQPALPGGAAPEGGLPAQWDSDSGQDVPLGEPGNGRGPRSRARRLRGWRRSWAQGGRGQEEAPFSSSVTRSLAILVCLTVTQRGLDWGIASGYCLLSQPEVGPVLTAFSALSELLLGVEL